MTAEQEIARLREENERLRALLPPAPGPGQRWRVGTKVAEHVYIHTGDHPKGFPVARMPSAEIAAFICAAANAYLEQSGWEVDVPTGL